MIECDITCTSNHTFYKIKTKNNEDVVNTYYRQFYNESNDK